MYNIRKTLALAALTFSAPAFAASWDWEWELLPNAWVDDVLDWSAATQEHYDDVQIKDKFMAPNAAHFCAAPPAACDDAIVFKRWAHYLLDTPESEPLPEPFPLGCTDDCLVEA